MKHTHNEKSTDPFVGSGSGGWELTIFYFTEQV